MHDCEQHLQGTAENGVSYRPSRVLANPENKGAILSTPTRLQSGLGTWAIWWHKVMCFLKNKPKLFFLKEERSVLHFIEDLVC